MTLLNEDYADEPSYALSFSLGSGGLAPEIRVAPRKKTTMNSYSQWAKGFQMYMSIYLSQSSRAPEPPALLKYQQTIRDLAERGGGWRSYDEAFRTTRNLRGWQWDSIHWELWVRAVQPMPPQTHTDTIYIPRPFSTKTDLYRPTPGGPRPQSVLPSIQISHAGCPTARLPNSAPHTAAIALRPGAMGGRNCQRPRGHLSKQID